MSYADILADLFPQGPYDPSRQVLATLLGAIGTQLDWRSQDGDSLANNTAPSTADIDGIANWEQVLGLPTDTTLSLQQRQQRCIAASFMLPGVLQDSGLLDILNSFSQSKGASVLKDPHDYKITGVIPIDAVNDYQQILRAVYKVLPAHNEFIMGFLVPGPTRPALTSQQMLIISRSVPANGGGPNPGRFLDGTWALDGTYILNSGASVVHRVASAIQVVEALTVPGQQQALRFGKILNSGPKLDGSWIMSGATYQAMASVPQVIINGSPVN